ncbi:MAG: phage tail protein, partial [Desulfobacteraceae bacterium]
MPTSNRYYHGVVWEYLQEAIDQNFTYPGVAILSVEIPATATLNGQWPTVEVKAKHVDYTTDRSSKNPAWAAYYRMTDKYGYDSSRLIYQDFVDWADFCTTNELTVSGYLDTQLTRKAVIDHIAAAGMAQVVPRGSQWGVIIDQAREPEHLFSSENIIAGTFEEEFVYTRQTNTVLLWYYDEDENYRRTPLKVRHPLADPAAPEVVSEKTLFWVSNRDQALKHLNVMLNKLWLIKRILKWESFVDAINCQPGDVTYLQSNLVVWGVTPGRVVSATSTTITCDIPLDFSDSQWSGRDLRVLVRHQSGADNVDDIERHEIINPYPESSVDTFTLSTDAFSQVPEADCVVAIGWVTGSEETTADERISVKEVEILNIEHVKGNRYKITAGEYYDDAYAMDIVVSSLPSTQSGLVAGNLVGGTSFAIHGRTQFDKIVLNWTGNASKYWIFYQVYDDAGAQWGTWRLWGSTEATAVSIIDLQPGFTYRFSVSTAPNPATGLTVDIDFQTADHVDVIESVSNLRCVATDDATWTARDLDLAWDPFGVFSLDFYRVEIWNAAEDTILRTYEAHRDKPRMLYTYEQNAQDHGGIASDSVKVRVVVVDVNGNESATDIVEFTNGAPDPITDLQTSAGSGDAFEGRDVDIIWSAPSGIEDLQAYEVVITHGGVDLRAEYVLEPHYLYTHAMNVEDGAGTPSNAVVVKVSVVDAFGNYSATTSATFTNPAPAVPGSLSTSPWMNGIQFTWATATDRDWLKWQYRIQVESEGWSSWLDTTTNE